MEKTITIEYKWAEIDGVPGSLMKSDIIEGDIYESELTSIMDAFEKYMDQRAKDGLGQFGKLEITLR